MPIRITRSIIPNLFTLANLYCGFSAIIMFTGHDFVTGAFYIFFAGVFDSLDGYMARLTNSASELGVELDSLCDAVSFGVAPSFLLYQLHYSQYPQYGMLVASLPAMAGVYRLARFNTQLTSLEDKSYFSGMPIPSGALTIVTFAVYFVLPGNIPNAYLHSIVTFVTVVTSLAMISTIKYDNLP
ncbi:MAG: CDP-diacylglycerol--serine O-phosphatidyltransferase, partial [Candidatus Kapabacteria bacterium]|nr:CDP-diacylglycerol--serine O-phosphatidyltransferase [Candidatus Kapabacteria bacterium]